MDDSIRVIQYLGSKLKILNEIKTEIDKITTHEEIVVDLFSGTGVVANYLAKDYRVIANDIQAYSSLITNVLVKGMSTKLSYEDLISSSGYKKNLKALQEKFGDILEYEEKVLDEEEYESLAYLCESKVFYNGKNIEHSKEKRLKEIFGDSLRMFTEEKVSFYRNNRDIYALFTLYYSNSYFSVRQCIEIDSLRKAIDEIDNNGFEDSADKQVLLVCLLHAVSEIVSSVGKNFAQPIKVVDSKGKIKKFAIRRCMRDRMLSVEEPFKNVLKEINGVRKLASNDNSVYQQDAIEFIEKVDLTGVRTIYLDPPYTIDHYSRFYHVLETLVEYDYPELEEKTFHGCKYLMNGRYRNDRVQSNYCIPSKGKTEFELLIKEIAEKNMNIVMSYSDSDDAKDTRKRVVSKDELLDLLKQFYPSVEVKNIAHKYRKLSSKEINRKDLDDSELLFICHF